MAALQFQLQHTDKESQARAGEIITDHGKIWTPIFMPVGTAGSVKAVTQQQLKEDVQAQVILGNTYHLFLRPGLETLEASGGLHRFMNWDGPVLTDSGGIEIVQLAVDTDPYIYHHESQGVLTRLSAEALLNVTAGTGSVTCTMIVEPR